MKTIILAFCGVLVFAQPKPIPPVGGSVPLGPKMSCKQLRTLTGYDFTVATATLVPASSQNAEYCRISGNVAPEIRFEVSLPTSWSRRFLMTGNGGYAGDDIESPQRAQIRGRAASSGFVHAASNTGHDAATEPGAIFARDKQKLYDYAFRSLHVTAETAKRVAEAYYGERPAKSYYQGCSTGGRQGLILAQRFPGDFDGIIAGAPVLDFTGTMQRYTCTAQALAEAPIPYPKLALLSDRIYAACDEKDGLKDGLIDDPRKCGFSASRDLPKCAAEDGPDCFTAGQIAALEKIYGDVVVNGKVVARGWPVGAEVAGPNGRSGWDPWIAHDGGPSISFGFAESFWRYMAFSYKNATRDLMKFDFEKEEPRLAEIRSILDATDPDLSAFRKHGGKLLMYYGWADQALNAQMGIDYYEAAMKANGAGAKDFFRFFLMPGVFHCGSGVGPDQVDWLQVLLNWTERSQTPERLVAAKRVENKTVRTRPLCAYPLHAKYKGSGSIDDETNFVCGE